MTHYKGSDMPAAMPTSDFQPSELQALLLQLRERSGLSQAELARRIHRSRSFVNKVESGASSVSVEVLFKWTDACGAPIRMDFLDQERDRVVARLQSAAAPPTADTREVEAWISLLRGYWRLDDQQRKSLREVLRTMLRSTYNIDIEPEPGPH